MAATYSEALRNARLNLVLDAIAAGAGTPVLELGTDGLDTILAVLPLAAPVGTVADGVLTFALDPDPSATALATGTATAARIKDGDGTVVVSGLTVGTSAADIILDATLITAGQTLALGSGTLTHG